MESFGPTQTAPAVTHCRVPDRKPPDKKNENADPVGAGAGVEKKSLAERLHSHVSSSNRFNRQADRRQTITSESDTKPSPKAENREHSRTTNAGSVRELAPYINETHWQSIGSVTDRLLMKGDAA